MHTWYFPFFDQRYSKAKFAFSCSRSKRLGIDPKLVGFSITLPAKILVYSFPSRWSVLEVGFIIKILL